MPTLRIAHDGPGPRCAEPGSGRCPRRSRDRSTSDAAVPSAFTGPEVKDAETIARIRVAARIAAQALQEVGRHVRPGVTTDELDAVGHDVPGLGSARTRSTLGYKGFPKSLCTSLNEVICHGIPDSTVVDDGDIVNIDITAFIDGVHGDTNATFLAGDVDEESRLLVERTYEAMMRGVRAVAPGRALNVVGRVIESYARRFGYGVVRDFTGHGIGTAFHSGLVVPHFDDPRATTRDGARHDVHDRADADARDVRLRHLGRRLDRRHRGPQAQRPVRARGAGDRGRGRDPHPAVSTVAPLAWAHDRGRDDEWDSRGRGGAAGLAGRRAHAGHRRRRQRVQGRRAGARRHDAHRAGQGRDAVPVPAGDLPDGDQRAGRLARRRLPPRLDGLPGPGPARPGLPHPLAVPARVRRPARTPS